MGLEEFKCGMKPKKSKEYQAAIKELTEQFKISDGDFFTTGLVLKHYYEEINRGKAIARTKKTKPRPWGDDVDGVGSWGRIVRIWEDLDKD